MSSKKYSMLFSRAYNQEPTILTCNIQQIFALPHRQLIVLCIFKASRKDENYRLHD